MREAEGFVFQDSRSEWPRAAIGEASLRASGERSNWNVTGTVNFAGDVLDRVHTKPYGEMTFDAETVNVIVGSGEFRGARGSL